MNWKSIDEPPPWRTIDESPALPAPAAKASSFVAELVLLVALAAGVAAYLNFRSAEAPPVDVAVAAPTVAPPPPPTPLPKPAPEPEPEPVREPEPVPIAVPATPLPEPKPDPKALVAVAVPVPVTLSIPPLPARTPEAEAYYREWRAAAARAAHRDLDGAASLIKKAGRGDEPVRR